MGKRKKRPPGPDGPAPRFPTRLDVMRLYYLERILRRVQWIVGLVVFGHLFGKIVSAW